MLLTILKAATFQKNSLLSLSQAKVAPFVLFYSIWVVISSFLIRLIWIYISVGTGFSLGFDEETYIVLLKPVLSTIVMDVFLLSFALVVRRLFLNAISGSAVIKVYIIARAILPLIVLATLILKSSIIPRLGFLYFALNWSWGILVVSQSRVKEVSAYVLFCLLGMIVAFAFLPSLI